MRACELLEVSRAAYYAHRAGVPSARQLADTELTEHIHQAHQASRAATGGHESTPNCVDAAIGMAASAWRG
jgi:hypothetical protein